MEALRYAACERAALANSYKYYTATVYSCNNYSTVM